MKEWCKLFEQSSAYWWINFCTHLYMLRLSFLLLGLLFFILLLVDYENISGWMIKSTWDSSNFIHALSSKFSFLSLKIVYCTLAHFKCVIAFQFQRRFLFSQQSFEQIKMQPFCSVPVTTKCNFKGQPF